VKTAGTVYCARHFRKRQGVRRTAALRHAEIPPTGVAAGGL